MTPPRAVDRVIGALLRALMVIIRHWQRRQFWMLQLVLGIPAKILALKERARLQKNVHRVFGLPPRSHFSLMFTRQVERHQIRCMVETIRGILDPDVLTVDGFSEIKELVGAAESGGKGMIITTAHLGSWEFVALFTQRAASRPFHVLAKPSRSRAVTEWLNDLRGNMKTPVLWTDKKSLLRDMLSALKRQESIGFVMDQKPEGRAGPTVSFFDLPTEFVSGPASMAVRTGAAVIAVYCVRTGPFRYKLLTESILPPGHSEADEVALTARLAQSIERAVRLYPEQWTWGYKRWRSSPALSE